MRVRSSFLVVTIALLLTWPANIISLKFIGLLARPDTRYLAQRWIEAHVPAGSKILLEGTISNEPTYAPPLLPTKEWFEAKQKDAQAAGTTGRIIQAKASLAARRGRPRYYLLESPKKEFTDFDQIDCAVLSSYDSPWVESFSVESFSIVKPSDAKMQREVPTRQAWLRRLKKDFTEEYSVLPFPKIRFDWWDNPDYWRLWEVPFTSYRQWIGGPNIKVYRRSSK